MIRRSAGDITRLLAADLRGDPGTPVVGVAIDSRAVQPGNLFVALPGARVDGCDFAPAAAGAGAAAALLGRPLALDLPQIVTPDPLAALQRLAAVERSEAAYRLAAITGSIGKTTTKEFLTALLGTSYPVGCTSGNRNSETGFPVELCNQAEGIAWMVAELGMSHAGELDRLGAIAQPDAVLITVVAPVHLEFFPDIEAVAAAKAELIRHLNRDGTLVLNARDLRVAAFAPRFSGTVLRYGVPGASDLWIDDYQGRGLLGATFTLAGALGRVPVEWSLPGRHQADNLLAAATLALALGVVPAMVAATAALLRPAPRRGEVYTLGNGVALVDDSYNSSPEAARALLRLLAATPGRRVAVLGEMLELGSASAALHREVGRRAAAAAEVVVAVGGAGAAELAHAAAGAETHRAATAAEALELLRSLVRPGDVVLVKGSRGVGLDAVVDGLRAEVG
jgi:UDP-N-acetylmuramoyl-tripeptide--D-alanyl-D-alanine ligase